MLGRLARKYYYFARKNHDLRGNLKRMLKFSRSMHKIRESMHKFNGSMLRLESLQSKSLLNIKCRSLRA